MAGIKFKNGEEYYHKIYVFFNATVAITILPLAIMLLQKQTGHFSPVVMVSWIKVTIVTVLLISTGLIIKWSIDEYKKGISKIKKDSSLRNILNQYYSIGTRKYVLLMLACGLCVIGYYTTANGLFIISYVVTMIFLSIKRPTLNLIIEELELSDEHKKVLIDKLDID